MKILVINAGSSSLKYQLIDMNGEQLIAKGICERIGIDGLFTYKPQLEGKAAITAALRRGLERTGLTPDLAQQGSRAAVPWPGLPRSAFDAVMGETPASAATSRSVGVLLVICRSLKTYD